MIDTQEKPQQEEKPTSRAPTNPAPVDDEDANFSPRGAFYFVIVVLVIFFIYWFLTYLEIVSRQ